MRDVRHVPDISLNIISAYKLDDEGYENHFGEGKWKLTKDSHSKLSKIEFPLSNASKNVSARIMALNIGEILSNMVMSMVLGLRGVFRKHLNTMMWLRG